MDRIEGHEAGDEERGIKLSAMPEIGVSGRDEIPGDRITRPIGVARSAVSLFLISLVVLAGLSAFEFLYALFFPDIVFRGIHVATVVFGALAAGVAACFVRRKFEALRERGGRQTADRERAETALRDSEELYKAVVENVADGIGITVGTERVLVNRAFLTIHGLNEASRVIAHPFDQFILPEDREETRGRVRARQRGENLDKLAEYRIQRPDGETRTIQASVEAIIYKGCPATLAVLRDVTEIKRAEMRIRDLNSELEQHVGDLEMANRDLEAFNSMASHDLRIPVIAIQGFSRRIADKRGEMLDEKSREWLAIIQSNAQRMGQLIEDLLAYSRLGRQAGHYGVISMEKLVESVIQDLRPVYPDGEVAVFPLPDAFGDERMVRQLVFNLLSNAFKFAAHGRKQIIEVGGRQDEGENVYTVVDNGVGFDMKDKETIFEAFQRLHSSDEFEGTGIGLAIVKRIASLHGGRVWAEGRPGEGATFYFTLPGRPVPDEEGVSKESGQ
jgi:PAS domain S-box-containing protein